MNTHTVQRFDEELDKLRSRLIKMGTLIQQQMGLTIQALSEIDLLLTNIIIKNDDLIDKIDIKIDKQCMKIFATQQPLASDLRMVMAALSMNDEMELIGDTLVDIAYGIINLKEDPFIIRSTQLIQMGKVVEKMIIDVLDSFIFSNYELSKEALNLINEVRELRIKNFDILTKLIRENPNNGVFCLNLQDINRNLKLIADLCVNIAHEIIFLAEARMVKHQFRNIEESNNFNEMNSKENSEEQKIED